MSNFAERLSTLIGNTPVTTFASKVGLSEALIRKYLKGSEPSLAKANQIAVAANCSLEWLATGCGYQYRQSEVVDMKALEMAVNVVKDNFKAPAIDHAQLSDLKPIIVAYQHLRAHKKPDGYFDTKLTENFLKTVKVNC